MIFSNACVLDSCYATRLQQTFAAIISLGILQYIFRSTHAYIPERLENDKVSNVDPPYLSPEARFKGTAERMSTSLALRFLLTDNEMGSASCKYKKDGLRKCRLQSHSPTTILYKD